MKIIFFRFAPAGSFANQTSIKMKTMNKKVSLYKFINIFLAFFFCNLVSSYRLQHIYTRGRFGA